MLDWWRDRRSREVLDPKQEDWQVGYTKGIQYLENMVIKEMMKNKARDENKTFIGMSLDVSSAYPSVERSVLLRALYEEGLTDDTWLYCDSLYKPVSYTHLTLPTKRIV